MQASPRGLPRPRRSRASGAAPLAQLLVGEQVDDRGRERRVVAGREQIADLRVDHGAVPRDVRGNDGHRAGQRARQHHPEALAAERRGHERLRTQQLARQVIVAQDAEDVDALVAHALLRHDEANGERVGADETQPRTGPAVDLGPRAQQDVHSLARFVAADEDDVVVPARRVGLLGHEHAVGDDRVLAAEPALRGRARLLGHRDAPVDPVGEEAPDGGRQPHPAEVAARVERGDRRAAPRRERRDADRRGHRLVHVDHVEPAALEDALHAQRRGWAEDDVGQRAVRGNDHRAADRQHVRRRIHVPAEPGMQDVRERARRVVPHHQPRIHAEGAQREQLLLRVVDDAAPKGP
jgi:hypothetical protein